MREARRVARRERERYVPQDERELDERDARARETRDERERERPRVRVARACPNIGDTHEAKRATPDASSKRGRRLRGEERASDRDRSVSNHRHQ